MKGGVLLWMVAVSSCQLRAESQPLATAVSDYFQAAKLRSVAILLCSPSYDRMLLGKALNSEGFQIGYRMDFSKSGGRRSGAVFDTSCNLTTENQEVWWRSGTVEWLLTGEGVLPTLLPDSCATLLHSDGRLTDLYRPGPGSQFVPSPGYSPGKARNHADLKGIPMPAARLVKVGGREENPGLYGGLECMDSPAGAWSPDLSLPIAQNLADQLNFRLEEVHVPDCRTLRRILDRNIVVLSTTALMITPENVGPLHFPTQLFSVKSRIVYKQPGLSSVTNLYVLPFGRWVWFCCLGTVLLTGLAMALALRFDSRPFDEPQVEFAELATIVIGFVCQQGTHLNPRSLSVRTAVVVFSSSALFLYTSYSANIVALLQSSRPTVRSLSDLSAAPLDLRLQNTSYNRRLVQDTEDPEVRKLLHGKQVGESSFVTVEEGVHQLRTGAAAFNAMFQVEVSAAYRRVSQLFEEAEKCGLSELDLFSLPPHGLATPATSGYRDLFARKLSRQLEVGLVSRWERRQTDTKPDCTAADGGFVSVGLTDFWPALMVLVFGSGAALAAFLLELVTDTIVKRKTVQFEDLVIY